MFPPLALPINTGQEAIDVTLNKLHTVLDQTIGYPNKVSSKVKQMQQGFDTNTQEHVFWFEYRVRLRNTPLPRPSPQLVKAAKEKKMALLRDLLAHDD